MPDCQGRGRSPRTKVRKRILYVGYGQARCTGRVDLGILLLVVNCLAVDFSYIHMSTIRCVVTGSKLKIVATIALIVSVLEISGADPSLL